MKAWALTLLLVAGTSSAQQSLRFTPLPDLPNPVGVAGPFAGAHGDALIVAGGANFPRGMPWEGGEKIYHSAIYVLVDGQWHTASERLPRDTAYGVSVSTADGLICVGGQSGSAVHRDVFRLSFDKTTRTITRTAMPPLPQGISFAAGARVQTGGSAPRDAIYIAGGQTTPSGSPGNTLYRLDLTRAGRGAFVWETLPPMPGPRRGVGAGATLDGKLYVVGGRDYGPARKGEKAPFAYHRDVRCYDPTEAKWTTFDLGRPVMAAAALADRGRLLLFGGATGLLLDHSLTLDDAAKTDFLIHHPGFPRDVRSFDPKTGKTSVIGALHSPHRMPVTTTAVRMGRHIVIPTGETSPGVRSPRVWSVDVDAAAEAVRFGVLNWLALGLYLLGMVVIGLRCSRKVKSTDEFFLAGRKIPWWAAGLSIFGTQLSAITFMAIPATTYGSDWVRIFGTFTLLLVIPIVVRFYLPTFQNLSLSTAYEFLERRFGRGARRLAASLFLLLQFGRMGIVLFLPSIALSAVTGMNVFVCITLMGVLAIGYTVLGGIEAVIWTDVAQVIVLMGGALLAFCIAVAEVGGIGEVLRIGAEADKFRVVHHGFALDSMTVPVMCVGLFVLNLIPYTSDQTVIQRYMTTASREAAARSLWTNFWMTAPTGLLFFGLGTALYAFYLTNPDKLTPLENDKIVPWFVVHELPAGIAGLAIAAIFAASMSSLDSSMNSVSTVLVFDFFRPLRPDVDDAAQLRLGRVLTLLTGLIGTATALLMASFDIKFLFDYFNKVLGLFGGALAGLFFLGIFCGRVRTRDALIGTLCGAVVVGILNFGFAKPPVHTYLFAACGFAVSILIGWTLARANKR